MIPDIRDMSVNRERWLTESDFITGVALGQALPGATAMQVAAYVGLRARGVCGALTAYLGFGTPAFTLMLLLSAMYFNYHDMEQFTRVFMGMKAVVVALITNAAINFSRSYCRSLPEKLLALFAGLWMGFKLNPMFIIIGAAVASIFLFNDKALLFEKLPKRNSPSPAPGLALLAVLLIVIYLTARIISPDLHDLAVMMFKIDCVAFGGGYVSIPLMLHTAVETHGWMTEGRFMDGIALGQITPGPIVMTAAFVGYNVKAWLGALIAAIYAFSPSFFLICTAAHYVHKVLDNIYVQRILHGSVVTLTGLMAAVAGRFILNVSWSPSLTALSIAAFLAIRFGMDVLWIVLGGAVLSFFL